MTYFNTLILFVENEKEKNKFMLKKSEEKTMMFWLNWSVGGFVVCSKNKKVSVRF